MFDKALLESSPARAPVLKKSHYLFATACGAVASLAVFLALAQFISPTLHRAAAVQSLVFGAVVAAFALMVCYVRAESRQLAMNTALWVAVVCLLNLPGFIGFLVATAAKTGDWKRAAIPCVYVSEIVLIGTMALVPLIYTEALPEALWRGVIEVPVPPPPPAAPAGVRAPRSPAHTFTLDDLMKQPTSIPPTVAQIHDEPLPPAEISSMTTGVQGGTGDPRFGALLDPVMQNLLSNARPQAPPPQATKPVPPRRIRIGTMIAAKAIYQPKPQYPELARIARTEGAVVIEAVIGKDGTIEELKVLRGNPLLVNAAIEAVRQWRYLPTLLNGEPVEVVTEITVNFKLAE